MFQNLAEADVVRLLSLNCGHKPYINAIHSKVSTSGWPHRWFSLIDTHSILKNISLIQWRPATLLWVEAKQNQEETNGSHEETRRIRRKSMGGTRNQAESGETKQSQEEMNGTHEKPNSQEEISRSQKKQRSLKETNGSHDKPSRARMKSIRATKNQGGPQETNQSQEKSIWIRRNQAEPQDTKQIQEIPSWARRNLSKARGNPYACWCQSSQSAWKGDSMSWTWTHSDCICKWLLGHSAGAFTC